jgi:hypothetical protein
VAGNGPKWRSPPALNSSYERSGDPRSSNHLQRWFDDAGGHWCVA